MVVEADMEVLEPQALEDSEAVRVRVGAAAVEVVEVEVSKETTATARHSATPPTSTIPITYHITLIKPQPLQAPPLPTDCPPTAAAVATIAMDMSNPTIPILTTPTPTTSMITTRVTIRTSTRRDMVT